MSTGASGLAQSVQVRLVRHAKEIGVDPNLVLTRYVVERFLYRLSRSPYAEQFVLKGALPKRDRATASDLVKRANLKLLE